MIYSMTAFTRIQHQGEWGSLVCEMRSINHRYLEIGMHLPDVLRVLEMPMRETIRKDLKRGKIECTIRYQAAMAEGSLLSINTELAKELCRASQKIAGFLKESAPVNPADILHFQGVISTQEADIKRLQEEVFHVMNLAIKDLMSARAREGEELKSSFEERLDSIQAEVAKVRKRL